ncbi:CRISPR-associated ring nuclease Csm6 [Methylomicrobium lacus]|uniref:CRISPR-associated ring nuclease Csm6 n=1 Tax=Methylomicrobium lacus TaxID=136992 RepID=UPI00045EB19B|nr:CRISPR-associated ring nuclease Csm6 [Methylomicrobium lacus]
MEKDANPQHILLCVTGLTPQVVTETLYALYRNGRAMPAQVHVLTTREGAERARLTLINDHWLNRFYRDYRLAEIAFGTSHIHMLSDPAGTPLQDIRSQKDNQSMADGITEMIRTLTADPDVALHVSIAGGRKTMGFYAGYALSLYGRPQDCLSHVLVSPDYESHPQFYYPTPYSQIIYGNDPSRKPLDTQNADVMLADIPFVRLRHGLDDALLQGKSSFSQTVAKAQQALNPSSLIIDLQHRRLIAQDQAIVLPPADLAFYCWLLKRQLSAQAEPTCPNDGAPESAYARGYLYEYQRINGEMRVADRTEQALQDGMSKAFFLQRISRINQKLKQTLTVAASAYLITAIGRRPHTRYRINLSNERIHLIPGDLKHGD